MQLEASPKKRLIARIPRNEIMRTPQVILSSNLRDVIRPTPSSKMCG